MSTPIPIRRERSIPLQGFRPDWSPHADDYIHFRTQCVIDDIVQKMQATIDIWRGLRHGIVPTGDGQ